MATTTVSIPCVFLVQKNHLTTRVVPHTSNIFHISMKMLKRQLIQMTNVTIESFLGDISSNATDSSITFSDNRIHRLEALLEGDVSMQGVQRDKKKNTDRRSLNIQKSLQILDESVSSPVTRTRGLRRSSFTPKSLTPASKYDTSAQFTSATPQLLPNESQFGKHLASSTMYGQTTMHGQSMVTDVLEDITEDITTTNVALLLEEDPGISACRGMYRDFLHCMKAKPLEHQSFDLLMEYEMVCREQVQLLYKLVNRAAARSDPKCQKTFNMLHLLEMEKNTWQLIQTLFHDRLEKELIEMGMSVDDMGGLRSMKKSEQQIVTKLFEEDNTIRESQLVIDWLERCAQDPLENFSENVKFFSDRAVAWENTLHKLKRSGGSGYGNERPLVTEMDPDAPYRQNKMLDDLDQEDESRLLQYLFICLRAGQIEKAQEVCKTHGQSWRAATLEGWKLYHDPNFEGPAGQIDPVQGNPYRVIWKSVCWAMAADPKYDVYEKAVYGALCGNLRAMLPVCKSWSDYVWAHYKVLVDMRAESEIRTMCSVDKSMDVPQEYWNQPSDADSIFHRIEACEPVRKDSQEFYHVIQKWIILGDVAKLLEVMVQWVRGQDKTLPHHLLRFMAHLVLFIRSTQQRISEDLCNVILEAYVEYLIQDDHRELVAHYVSKLPPKSQVHWYAKFLEGIDKVEEKQVCLKLAEEVNLDIPQITKTVVENIRNRSTAGFTATVDVNLDITISEDDKKKIAAIDWLVFDQSQRAEAMKQANAVMRTFIAVKKVTAAKEVFDKLPVDSIDVMYRSWFDQTGTEDLPADDENAIREYLCIKAYLNAMESFNDWFNKFHNTKPVKPPAPHSATFTEKVAYEHRIKQYEHELTRWQHNLIMQTETTKRLMYNVLLFTNGGWMVDLKEFEEDDSGRQQQLESLRQLVLPGLCFLLHDILHKSQQYAECLQLADHIASEQNCLYKVFRPDELQHLLQLMRDSSLAVLNQNKDPLGYEVD